METTPTAPGVNGEAATSVGRPLVRVPLVLNRRNFSWLTERISGVVENPAPRWWWVAFTITASVATFGLVAETKQTEGRHACGDGKSYPPPARRGLFDNAGNSFCQPTEIALV